VVNWSRQSADGAVAITGKHVSLRPMAKGDIPVVAGLLSEPEVAQWWGSSDVLEAAREIVKDPATKAFAIEVDGQLVGLVQYVEELDPDYRHASIDIILSAAYQDRGLGRDALATISRYLVDQRGHHRLTIDPRADNERAIRAYSAVGFKPVGIMRHYERGTDGQWRDGLLMDLVADELQG
jgi:aminoglycoside 6'-N-acetyltransferase